MHEPVVTTAAVAAAVVAAIGVVSGSARTGASLSSSSSPTPAAACIACTASAVCTWLDRRTLCAAAAASLSFCAATNSRVPHTQALPQASHAGSSLRTTIWTTWHGKARHCVSYILVAMRRRPCFDVDRSHVVRIGCRHADPPYSAHAPLSARRRGLCVGGGRRAPQERRGHGRARRRGRQACGSTPGGSNVPRAPPWTGRDASR